MHRPERLWEQYLGKAESEALRGSGLWPLQAKPCSLEPPWDEFDRRSLSLWDCMLHGWEAPWEGSWLNRLLNPSEPVWRQGQPVVLPEIPCRNTPNLRRIIIEQFPDDESTIPKAEEFLRSLPGVSWPVSFEILGAGAEPEYDHDKALQIFKDQEAGLKRSITEAISGWTEPYTLAQFVAHADDAPRIERQLLAHYPNSAVVATESCSGDPAHLASSDVQNHSGYGSVLGLEHYFLWPLRRFTRLDPDPLGVAIAAMEHLDREEWALLQIVFQPATAPWAETVREAVADPYKEKEFLLPELTDRILREKFSSPLFAVSVRLFANRQDVYRQLRGWAEQFARPPQAFDFLLEDGEGLSLSWAIDTRCTFRPGVLLNGEELAGLIHLPGRSVVSKRLRQVRHRTRPAAEVPPKPDAMFLGENTHRGRTQPVYIPARLRERHCYIAGASGTGKSTLLLNMILQDIQAGHGVGVLDPHGDLADAVLARIPENRVDDVILFDPTDEEYPFALNILEAKDAKERERIVVETLMLLERYFSSSWGQRLERILTLTLYSVLEALERPTLSDVERMLIDPGFRRSVVEKLRTRRYRDFWRHEFPSFGSNAIDPVLNKLSVFLLNRTVRNIICQRRSGIDFDRLINGNGILIAKLSSGLLSDRVAETFGNFLVSKIVGATFRRARMPHEQRRPWYLYVDEFQKFMNLSIGFDQILAEARKYRLVLAGIANQYVGQLTQPVRQAIFGNVGVMTVFRLGAGDARIVDQEMGMFTADEILSLEVGQAIARAGGSDNTFNLRTYPEPDIEGPDPTRFIQSQAQSRYARPRQDVEKNLDAAIEGDELESAGKSIQSGPKRRRRRRMKKGRHESPDPKNEPRDPLEDDLVS